MKRHPIFYFLAGVMALSLTACMTVGGEPEPAPAPTLRSPAPTFSPEPTPTPGLESDVPPGKYAPWQTAYAAFLSETAAKDYPPVDQAAAATETWDQSDSYSLYDVDKDGVPELFIRYGLGEAGYHTACYAFREGEVATVGDFPSGHASLYTLPGENGLIQHWGHMGYASMERYTIQEGKLVFAERFFEEDIVGQDRKYTEPGQLLSGSKELAEYTTHQERARRWTEPLTLPIYDYNALPRLLDAPLEESEVRKTIGKVLEENGEVRGCSGDGFYGGTGRVSLEEYLLGAYPYSPLTVAAIAWPDMNGDGQTDCVLRLEGKEGDNTLTFYAVLNVQDGTVYAYFFGFMDGLGVDPNGSAYFREYTGWRQVSFYEEQCYDFPSQDPVEGAGPAWDDFS